VNKILVLGEYLEVIERGSDRDSVEIRDGRILINRYKKSAEDLIKEFLAEYLYNTLFEIYDEIKREGKVEVLGTLDFEVVERIDNKEQRIAKLKGDKILVKINAVILPKPALKYIIAHEMAHIFAKKHTKKFWEIVKKIYPDFETGREILFKYEKYLKKPLIIQFSLK